MTRLTRSDAPVEHVASTPIAVPTGEPGPLVTAPAGPVRGVWRRIVSAPTVVVLGNEHRGIDPNMRRHVPDEIYIPNPIAFPRISTNRR